MKGPLRLSRTNFTKKVYRPFWSVRAKGSKRRKEVRGNNHGRVEKLESHLRRVQNRELKKRKDNCKRGTPKVGQTYKTVESLQVEIGSGKETLGLFI